MKNIVDFFPAQKVVTENYELELDTIPNSCVKVSEANDNSSLKKLYIDSNFKQ